MNASEARVGDIREITVVLSIASEIVGMPFEALSGRDANHQCGRVNGIDLSAEILYQVGV